VKEAGNAEAALEQIRQGTAIELLIADVILPGGMDGRGLAKAAGDLIPDLKILYISGYTEDAIVHHGRLDPGVQLLVKPFAQNEFATKIRDILESPAGHDAL
jgi:CheY-like chemotaxis protein